MSAGNTGVHHCTRFCIVFLKGIISFNGSSNTIQKVDIPIVSILEIKTLRADDSEGKNIGIIWRHDNLQLNIQHLHYKIVMAPNVYP